MVAVLTGLVCLVMTALLMSLTDVMHAGQDPLLLTFLGGGTVALGLVLRSALISGLLFALSAEDSHSHIEVIKMLASICMEESRVEDLATCETPEEIYRLLTAVAGG